MIAICTVLWYTATKARRFTITHFFR